MRYLLITVLTLMIVGCATPKHQVLFTNVHPGQVGMKHVVDNRSEKERDRGRMGLALYINRMADNDFLPAPVQLLDARVAYEMSLLGRSAIVKVDHFDVLDVHAYSGSKRQANLNNEKKESWAVTGFNTPAVELQDDAKRTDFVQCHIKGHVQDKMFSVHAHERYVRSDTMIYDIVESKPFVDATRRVTESCVDKALKEIVAAVLD
ncbi:hypothetical protein MNBD_GAMMA16-164 [hydrothermal vent metagenome]|uniref:Uncharacterized protein n=1 Tax=hydrothermal vent metagenome TaxID=652676 RepID=A0A3B0YWY3_9ZZZZ